MTFEEAIKHKKSSVKQKAEFLQEYCRAFKDHYCQICPLHVVFPDHNECGIGAPRYDWKAKEITDFENYVD